MGQQPTRKNAACRLYRAKKAFKTKKARRNAVPLIVFCRLPFLREKQNFLLTVRIGDKSVFVPFTEMSESGTPRFM